MVLKNIDSKFFCDDSPFNLTAAFDKLPNLNRNNCDENFDLFIETFLQVINKHAPLTKLLRKKRRLNSKPWITKGVLTSIRNKQ